MPQSLSPVREPVYYGTVLSAILGVIVTLNWRGLTSDDAALIVAAFSAVVGAVVAWRTRPIAPAAFTAVVTASAALLAGYGFHISPEFIGALNALLVVILSRSRHAVSPVIKGVVVSSGPPVRQV